MLAILDCHRDPDYMAEMLASADGFQSWRGERWQIWNGTEPVRELPNFQVQVRRRDGTALALVAACQLAIERDADSLLVLEDDVKFDPGGLELVQDFVIPDDVPLVSFFQHELKPERGPVVQRIPFIIPEKGEKPRYSWLQCVLFSVEACRALVSHPLVSPRWNWPRPAYGDKLVGRAFYPRWEHYGVYWPNVIEHLGDKSSYGWDSSKWKRQYAST